MVSTLIVFQRGIKLNCWRNSVNAVSTPNETIAVLSELSLTGNASSGGTDEVIVSIGSTMHSASGNNSIADLTREWQAAEFNVLGFAGGSQAIFNPGATIIVKTSVDNGTTNTPVCTEGGDLLRKPTTSHWEGRLPVLLSVVHRRQSCSRKEKHYHGLFQSLIFC